MKTKITLLLTILTLTCFAQNGIMSHDERMELIRTNGFGAYLKEIDLESRSQANACFTNHIETTNNIPDPSITLRLETITNWTGVLQNGQELGYVATNHVAVVYYQGATNEFTLKTTASETAKWRPSVAIKYNAGNMTNVIWGQNITNWYIQSY